MGNTFKLAPVFLLALLLLAGCVSTPQGKKFDPVAGIKRLDEDLDSTVNRWQDRSYHDLN